MPKAGSGATAASIADITERKQAKELSDALNAINMALSSTLDYERIMEQVVMESVKAVGSEAAGILLLEDGEWAVRYLYGLSEEWKGTRFTEEEARGAMLAAATGSPVVSNDAVNDPRLNPRTMERYGVRSMLVVALTAREEVFGALYFSNHSAPVPFTAAQVDFAAKLSASVSLAIENARLLREERNIADTLQEALIAMPKRLPGIDYGFLYRSATEAAEVGGDFYDLFELEHGKIGVVIGDVSGKGLEAATLTSLVKNTIKAYAYQEDSPPIILAKTNEVVRKSSAPSVFVTVFLGILDTRAGILSYCNAGHPPPLVRRKAGRISVLKTSSPAIGIFPDLDYQFGMEALEKGDLLVLYTDGVTEARCDSRFFGEKRLMRFMRELKSPSPNEVPQLIFNELSDYCRCLLVDDLAMLAVALDGEAVRG